MKKGLLLLCPLFLFTSIQANALLIPMYPTDGGDYFSTKSITFVDSGENASYESDFGLFSMKDPTDKYKIFSYNQEHFAITSVTSADWKPLTSGFGFYFDVHTGGLSDATVEYNWFSDSSLNQLSDGTARDVDVEHVSTNFFNEKHLVVSLDDQLGGGDRDFDDMVVDGRSDSGIAPVSTAPVPEPATMLLFGTGLIGLLGVSRRKKK